MGLAVGVALVVTVTALSTGLDRAQAKVLKPLTGVGTDLSVTRPGQTVVVMTHDLAVAAEADRVLRMRDGRLLEAEQPAAASAAP